MIDYRFTAKCIHWIQDNLLVLKLLFFYVGDERNLTPLPSFAFPLKGKITTFPSVMIVLDWNNNCLKLSKRFIRN
jgi:hypothetical protein